MEVRFHVPGSLLLYLPQGIPYRLCGAHVLFSPAAQEDSGSNQYKGCSCQPEFFHVASEGHGEWIQHFQIFLPAAHGSDIVDD